MKISITYLAVILILLNTSAKCYAQIGYKTDTFLFATHGKKKLYLDRLTSNDTSAPSEKKPVLIYLFGGGWESGDRKIMPGTESFFNGLVSQGYTVISIDYRLGIKEAKEKGLLNSKNGTQMYLKAIDIAVEDLYLATKFLLIKQKEWNIDPKQIVLLGGSSGATTSIVAEYGISNNTVLAKKNLPADFNYAGVVSMAGALWIDGENTPSEWKNKPCPFLFFIGNKDQVVTYDESHTAGFAGYGGSYLSRQFTDMGVANWFYDYIDGDHLIAAAPLMNRHEEINTFLKRFIKEKQELFLHTIEKSKIPTDFLHLDQVFKNNGKSN